MKVKICAFNDKGYKIEVYDELCLQSPQINVSSFSKQSPWLYVKNLLDSHMSAEDENFEEYQSEKVTQGQKHRYTMFITDKAAAQTIHIGYVSPKEQGKMLR